MNVGRAITEAMREQRQRDTSLQYVWDRGQRHNIRHLGWFRRTYMINPRGEGFVRR